MKASVRLNDGTVSKLSVPATVNSVMLTNHLSFVDEDDEILLDVQLGPQEWQMYADFVTEVAKLERETGKRFTPNLGFSKHFFAEKDQSELETYGKIADYMICSIIHESLDFFVGSLFDLDRETILKAYNVTETPEQKKKACKDARLIVNDRLIAKALEVVPELAGHHFSFTD